MRIYERFRFRVWDVDEKEYWYDHCLIHGRDGSLVTENLDSGEFLEFDNPPILEQATGVRDSNGKMIYEGDIVKSHESEMYYAVVWNEKWCRFATTNVHSSLLLSVFANGCEVVGNIHETPRLIDDTGKSESDIELKEGD